MNKAHDKMVLRYAVLMSQKEKSKTDIDEMNSIEDQLHLTPERILKEATEYAIKNIRS